MVKKLAALSPWAHVWPRRGKYKTYIFAANRVEAYADRQTIWHLLWLYFVHVIMTGTIPMQYLDFEF